MHKLLLTFALTALAVPQVIAAPQEIRHIAASSADSLRLPTLNFVEPTTQSPYGQAQLQAPDRKAQAPAVLKKMRPSTGTFTNEPDMPDMFGFNWTYPWTIMQIDEPDMKETHLLSAEDWPVTLYLRNGNLVGTHFQDNPGGATMLHASFNANGYNNWAYTQFISRAEIAKRVLRTAYDPHTDMVYGLSVADAEKKDKFGFVKFYADKRKDPVTGSEKVPLANITVLNDALPAACECSALAWDPRDGNVIGVSVAGQVIRFNTETGKHQVIFDTGKVNSTYFGGLAYSPSHRGFIWCYLVTEEGKTISQDYYLIDTDNRTCKLLKSVGRDADGVIHQVSSLIVNNTYADPLGPVTAKITADNFEPRASSGSLTVEIPSVNEKGQALVGNLTYMLRVDGIQTTDGKSYIEASVAPGSVRTDRIEDLTDGPHRITIYTKTADGHWSRPLHTVKFTGYDTPLMPQNVKLDAEYLTWDPVTEGINGIDITSDGVEYEVWVDEKLVGTTTSTSYRMDFDPVELLSHLAAVYAVNHDKMSYPSFSNRVTVGEYRTVPATFVPEASDVLLSTTVNPEGDSGEWLYNSNYGAWCKQYSSSVGNDDWLFLPPLNFDDSEALYEISYELLTDKYDESLDMLLCDSPVADTGNLILSKTINTRQYGDDFMKVTAVVPASGVKHIAFHTTDVHANIYLRNVQVKKTGATTSAPAAVTDLTVKPGAKGALASTATFTFPATNVKGDPLPADTDIKVEIRGVYSNFSVASTTGKPGATGTIVFTPSAGLTDIFVTPSVQGANGLPVQTTFWAGPDVPAHVKNLKVTLDDDPMVVHIKFDAPGEVGYHGGYADPASTVYYLLIKKAGASKWSRYEPVDYTEIRLDLKDTYEQTLTYFAVMTENVTGASNKWDSVDLTCGKPHTLPMRETMPNGYPEYNPVVTQNPTDEYTGSCGFANPAQIKPEYAVPSGNALGMMPPSDGKPGKAMLEFPYFSTVGAVKPAIYIQALLDPDVIAQADAYGVTAGIEPVKLGSWNADTPGTRGYNGLVFPLPQSLIGKKWVKVYVDASFPGGEKRRFVVIERYSVMEMKDNDLCLMSVLAPEHIGINRESEIMATVCNFSGTAKPAPALEVTVTDATGKVTVNTVKPAQGATISPDGLYDYIFPISPDADALGEMKFVLSIPDDDVVENNMYETTSLVDIGAAVVCTTLNAERDADDKSLVHLNWTKPFIFSGTENMERLASFDRGKYLGSFLNLDLDGSQTFTWEKWDFPGEEEPHAFLVFDDRWSELPKDNTVLKAHSGHKFLLALAPLNYVTANDWLISPEVEPGSEVSFWLNTVSTYYGPDMVGVLVSDGSTNPDDFEMLQFKRKNTDGWEEISVTLPETAKRFAIHYYSNDTFGIMIDDISYTPAGGIPTLQGFEVERDGVTVQSLGSDVTECTDSGVNDAEHFYHVYPSLLTEAGTRRGDRSPTAYVGTTSGIGALQADVTVTVCGHNIIVKGADPATIVVTDTNGLQLSAASTDERAVIFRADTGIYIVKAGAAAYKVCLR